MLIHLIGHFYGAKHRELELANSAHLQAIYETGARVTHDIKNLFISDGSQFTTGAAENPTLTIVTLAIRQADYIAEQMGNQNI